MVNISLKVTDILLNPIDFLLVSILAWNGMPICIKLMHLKSSGSVGGIPGNLGLSDTFPPTEGKRPGGICLPL